MIDSNVIKEKRINSTNHRADLPGVLKQFAESEGYPVGRIRWSDGESRFFGYGQGYLVAAQQLPPIPGGWDLTIESAPKAERKIWIPDTMLIAVKTNSGLPRLLDSYLQEGLEFEEIEDEDKTYHDVAGKVYLVKGNPRLIDMFEQVLDGF